MKISLGLNAHNLKLLQQQVQRAGSLPMLELIKLLINLIITPYCVGTIATAHY